MQDIEGCERTLQYSPGPCCWFTFPKTHKETDHTHTHTLAHYFCSQSLMQQLAPVTLLYSLSKVSPFHHFSPLKPLPLSLQHNKLVAAPHCSRCSHRCNSSRAPPPPHPVSELDREEATHLSTIVRFIHTNYFNALRLHAVKFRSIIVEGKRGGA